LTVGDLALSSAVPKGFQRSASATIAAISPITVSQETAEISNSIRVFIAHAAAGRQSHSDL
jgi:hypothetical protein